MQTMHYHIKQPTAVMMIALLSASFIFMILNSFFIYHLHTETVVSQRF